MFCEPIRLCYFALKENQRVGKYLKYLVVAWGMIILAVNLLASLNIAGIYILLCIGLLAIAIFVNYKVARKFEQIAFAKGQTKDAHAFEMCFFLGIVGYLYVIALPNANFDIKRLNQQKRIIELLQNLDEKTGESF